MRIHRVNVAYIPQWSPRPEKHCSTRALLFYISDPIRSHCRRRSALRRPAGAWTGAKFQGRSRAKMEADTSNGDAEAEDNAQAMLSMIRNCTSALEASTKALEQRRSARAANCSPRRPGRKQTRPLLRDGCPVRVLSALRSALCGRFVV